MCNWPLLLSGVQSCLLPGLPPAAASAAEMSHGLLVVQIQLLPQLLSMLAQPCNFTLMLLTGCIVFHMSCCQLLAQGQDPSIGFVELQR